MAWPPNRDYGTEVRPTVAGLLAFSALVAAPAPAHALPPADIVAFIDGQRRDNGIAGGLKEDPALSQACERHNHYLSLNPDEGPHQETPDHPDIPRTER
jgi:hypothetical protein